MTVGERIKQARKKSNMTQKELADKIGTTHQNISQYERDLRNPKIETIQKNLRSTEHFDNRFIDHRLSYQAGGTG